MEWADSCDYMGSCQLPWMESHTEERGRAGERWLSRTLQPVSSNTRAHRQGQEAMPLVELTQQPAPGNQCRPLTRCLAFSSVGENSQARNNLGEFI